MVLVFKTHRNIVFSFFIKDCNKKLVSKHSSAMCINASETPFFAITKSMILCV